MATMDRERVDDQTIWWCAYEQRAIPRRQQGEDVPTASGWRRACGPNIQCTEGRRRSLPCGWYRITPVDDTD